ncbi:MAG: PD40 domain-containing protein [Lewinellaceae bacterium]|nr:PD40 domain-containing protein [Lewinellaceae bacterium]
MVKKSPLAQKTRLRKSGNSTRVMIYSYFMLTAPVSRASLIPRTEKTRHGFVRPPAKFGTSNQVKIYKVFKDIGSPVLSVAFSPDGKTLATGSEDKTAKIWNLESGKDIQTLSAHTASVSSVAFPPDGKTLATSANDKSAKIWDLESGKSILTLYTNAYISNVVFSPDGKNIATSSEDINATIWDVRSGKNIQTLQGHNNYVMCIAFSPDGKKLATGSKDGTAKIWDLNSGKDILTLSGTRLGILSIAFSPDGKKLATCSDNGMTKIWDLNAGKDILTLNSTHLSVVQTVAFSPDGKKLATGCDDHTAKIWELTPEGWISSADRNSQLAGLIFQQLDAYNLSGLLDIRPENEQILKQSKDSRQITAFAELSAQNTRNSRDLRRTATDFGRAARLYGYAFDNSGDSALLVKLGDLYLRWAEDILASNRPDTAAWYIDLTCRLYVDKYQCPKLWDVYAQKTGTSFKFDQFIASERADELKDYGDYFFEKEQWVEARQLYEKAQRKQYSTAALQKLYLISEKTGESFDFQRFLALENTRDLYDCANFFIRKGRQLEKFKDRIPDYLNALLLWDKLIKLDTAAHLRVETANEYNNLGFYQLFLPDGKAAEFSIRRALELDPANKFTHTNLAPALLLQGKTNEAEEAYKKWAPLPFNAENLATYRDAFLDDLKKMEEQGVQGFDFARVREWLEEKN